MKILKKILCLTIIITAIFTLSACDGFNLGDILNDEDTPDYSYSEGGTAEIDLFFTALNNMKKNTLTENSSIKVRFNVNAEEITDGVSETTSYQIELYGLNDAGTLKSKFNYTAEGKNLSYIGIGNNKSYIDNIANTVSTNPTSTPSPFVKMVPTMMILVEYGIVSLKDNANNPQWTFIERKYATVSDVEGASVSAIQFDYEKTNPNEGEEIKMHAAFLRTFPTLKNLSYEFYANDVLTNKLTIFTTFLEGSVTTADFAIPGTAEGYSAV